MQFKRGDKVQDGNGRVMQVLAASDMLAMCAFDENGVTRQSIFQVADLQPADVQQEGKGQSGPGDQPES